MSTDANRILARGLDDVQRLLAVADRAAELGGARRTPALYLRTQELRSQVWIPRTKTTA
jgi:hypothetical protein